jgi:TRAP-type mannitol/chloroaromatic compound transport system permease large subunit
MGLFSGYIIWWSLRNPDKVPPAEPPTTFMEKMRRSGSLIPCTLLIVFIVWVMVIGWATATESAAYGVLGSLAIAWWQGALTWPAFWASAGGLNASRQPSATRT